MRLRRSWILLLALTASLGALAHAASRPTPPIVDLKALKTPARIGSGQPYLAVAAEGAVFLSWLEAADSSGRALKVSRLTNHAWSAPMTVTKGDSFFVNASDVPVVAALGGDKLMVAWPWLSGGDRGAYHVRLSGSIDGGRHWTYPMIPHRDDTPTEHGFVSLVAAEERGVRVFWLDGRKYGQVTAESDSAAPDSAEHHHAETSLRTAWMGFDGSIKDEEEVDDRVCDCCPTAAVGRGTGALVVYRDRTREEVRDISIAWLDEHGWSDPAPVHADGWKINACPVNGPAMDAIGDRLAVAWFTEKDDVARAYVAFSNDHGRSFGAPIRIDDGQPMGRVSLVMLDDGSALAGWMEARGSDGMFRVRRVSPTQLSPSLTVARTSSNRISGIPRMVRTGDRIVFAWTAVAGTPQVLVAVARVPS